MSRWTHVTGMIRVDGLRISKELENIQMEKDIKKLLGEPKNYEAIEWDDDGNPNTKVPCGSEGSLNYEIHLNTNFHQISAGYISIFGDLRDFGGRDDIMKIHDWFENACRGLLVRQAVVEISDEYRETPTIFHYNGKELIEHYGGINE